MTLLTKIGNLFLTLDEKFGKYFGVKYYLNKFNYVQVIKTMGISYRNRYLECEQKIKELNATIQALHEYTRKVEGKLARLQAKAKKGRRK